jgi:hypothetical protein
MMIPLPASRAIHSSIRKVFFPKNWMGGKKRLLAYRWGKKERQAHRLGDSLSE